MTGELTTTAIPQNFSCRIANDPMSSAGMRAFFVLVYFSIFVTAVTGNLLVVYVVMTNKRMQTVTNIFITNLAISDLLVNFTSLWLTPTYTYVGHWIWGGWLCHGLPLFQGTSIFISTLTLMAIAIDRYIVIIHNSGNLNINDRMSMKTCILIVTLIWLFSLILVMPYAINMSLHHITACNFWVCTENWGDQRLKKGFGVVVMTLQFLLPFTIIGISYTSIWFFLRNRPTPLSRSSEITRRKRLLRMLTVMVVIFGVCWFPFNLLNILRDLHADGWIRPYFSHIFLFVHLISMTATCWNPILYAWMNEFFRKEFLRALPFIRCQREQTQDLLLSVNNSKLRQRSSECEENKSSFGYKRFEKRLTGMLMPRNALVLESAPQAEAPNADLLNNDS